ncbi:hypothetical protein D1AOALGA4SA_10270 [Olavius algarvensis Delta 1 endosymbiont]|nr:hypothetical protein D1AOALGA4SA_10270 [Olavius algarvensis Delta 1 endosymbiont]
MLAYWSVGVLAEGMMFSFINPATNYVIPAAAERRAGIQQPP